MTSLLPIRNIAGYCFGDLGNLTEVKADLLQRCRELGIKGTVLVTPEGINLSLAGQDAHVQTFLDHYASTFWLPRMILHTTYSREIPFTRMLVKIKKEIIAFGVQDLKPAEKPAPYIYADELKSLYEKGEDFLLLDTRNDYEVRVGTFHKAKHLDIANFRTLTHEMESLLETHKEKPIVTVCTGGVRCEKAALLMLEKGFKNVRQLHGGFLSYFKACGDAFYEGDCFIFDKRVAVTPSLEEADLSQCYACRNPLTKEDLKSPQYEETVSCPYCYGRKRS